MRIPRVVLLAPLAVVCGCVSTSHHLERLADPSLNQRRMFDVLALENDCDDPQVQDALIQVLDDPDPAMRSCAAGAIGRCPYLRGGRRERAYKALVALLEDTSSAPFCALRGSGLFAVYVCGRCLPPRISALYTLVSLTGRDFGFDQGAWLGFLETLN